jgi:hypothetical protein
MYETYVRELNILIEYNNMGTNWITVICERGLLIEECQKKN